ncbi:MAG TPA: hypothetical protein PKA63_07230 [Oligoflexia bacterium]|nr:hypothetical protein [Oligoflexia bacterium]HMP48441.1 hypothetical protein [Oligoflexia bacterium]
MRKRHLTHLAEFAWQEHCYDWNTAFQKKGLQTYARWAGSLKTRLFTKPKPKSQNPNAPEGVFVEVDGHIDLPASVNVQEEPYRSMIMEITDLQDWKDSKRKLWDVPEPRILGYKYLEIRRLNDGDILFTDVNGNPWKKVCMRTWESESVESWCDIGRPVCDSQRTWLELEVAFWGTDNHLEISDFWSRVFSRKERTWHRNVRERLRAMGNEDGLEAFKEYLCIQVRWNMYAGIAAGYFRDVARPCPGIEHLVENWEEQKLPQIPDQEILGFDLRSEPIPRPKTWVSSAIQRAMKKQQIDTFC